MLLVIDSYFLAYLEVSEKLGVDELINKKIFTASDTPLTYRQINSLDSDKLLAKTKNEESKWRKFSIKEMVYILIVKELKKFGLNHNQLNQLWQSFFEEKFIPINDKETTNKLIAEVAIGLAFAGIEVTIGLTNDGQVNFYDPLHTLFFANNEKSLITIKLNNIINDLLIKIGKESIPTNKSVNQILLKSFETDYSSKEEKLLQIIRDRSYSAIRIKKKNGEVDLIYAERIKTGKEVVSISGLIEQIKDRDYQDINVVQRDGKIVSCKVEETIKL